MATSNRATSSSRRTTTRTQRASAAGTTSTKGTPTLASLRDQMCANCDVGVLHVIRYDPDALHEVGQSLAAENQHESGGAYETQCFYCGQRLSYPLGNDDDEGGAA